MRALFRAFELLLRATAKRRDVEGITVLLVPDDDKTVERVLDKVSEAIEMIARHSPRHVARLKRHVRYVLIAKSGLPNPALFERTSKTVHLDLKHVDHPETATAHIAASIVHETTHAWLEAVGFKYVVERRQRIEAVCIRAEAAFARRIPGGEALSEYYERRAQSILADYIYLTDEAFESRRLAGYDTAVDRLHSIGVPRMLLRGLGRLFP